MIRLIAVDLDGTLLDSRGQLPPANRDAVHAAVAAGIHVAIVTGRSYPFARPAADGLPASLSLVVSNGAVERRMDGSRVATRLLPRGTARRVLEDNLAHRDGAALIFDRDREGQLVFDTMDWAHPGRAPYWRRNQVHIQQVSPLEHALVDEDPIQVMFNGAVGPMRALVERLRAAAAGYAVSLTEYVDRDFSLVDITAPEATKGQALASIAGRLGVSRDEIMAIGDNFNDLEMLELAGTPVVMGNAATVIRERGWHVTASHDENGVAEAITALALA